MIKKIIFLFLSMISFIILPAKSEEIGASRYWFNAYENPIYYQYFDDYMNILGIEFGKIKFFRKDWQVDMDYKINSDGTISDIIIDEICSDKLNRKKIKKIVESNLPLKFYDGMDKSYVNIKIQFGVNKYTDEYSIWYRQYCPYKDDGCFYINMNRKI